MWILRFNFKKDNGSILLSKCANFSDRRKFIYYWLSLDYLIASAENETVMIVSCHLFLIITSIQRLPSEVMLGWKNRELPLEKALRARLNRRVNKPGLGCRQRTALASQDTDAFVERKDFEKPGSVEKGKSYLKKILARSRNRVNEDWLIRHQQIRENLFHFWRKVD